MDTERNDDYWKAAASMVGSEQRRLEGEGMTRSDARFQAYTNVASTIGDITALDLASGIGSWATHQPKPPKPPCVVNGTLFPDEKGPTALLMAWIRDNDNVAADNQLAHFTGHTASAFAYARNTVAKREGYDLEKVAHGCWRVATRPKQRPTIEDIESMAQQKADDFRKQLKDELLKDFGYR